MARPIDRARTIFYKHSIVTMALLQFPRCEDVGRKSPKKPTVPSFAPRWGGCCLFS